MTSKLLRGGAVLTIGRVAGYCLSFLRNLLLARLLAKADYGLAAAFSITISLLELGSRMAFGQQIVQSAEGDSPRFEATAHTFQFVAGFAGSLLIAALGFPLARLFGVPQAGWAFVMLAVPPLCLGLSHLDVCRRQREFDYLPGVLVDVIPQLLITLAVWPLVLWLGDYRVIVWLMIGKAVMGLVMSFWFARRPYRWAWDRAYGRSMIMFSWPLLLNGFVMFGSQQADQMIVGSAFSLETLASYSLAFSLASIPWFIFGQVGTSLILPIMSRAQQDPQVLRRQYRLCVQMASAFGAVFMLPMIMFGEQLVTALFGAKFQGTGVFVSFLGASFAVRFLRFAPAITAFARADTINELISNLWRGISLPLALIAVALGESPELVAAFALAAELVAAMVSILRLRRRQGVPLSESWSAVGFLIGFLAMGWGAVLLGAPQTSYLSAFTGMIACVGMTLVVAWRTFPDVSVQLLTLFGKVTHTRIAGVTPSS